jgi:hypothetical protein
MCNVVLHREFHIWYHVAQLTGTTTSLSPQVMHALPGHFLLLDFVHQINEVLEWKFGIGILRSIGYLGVYFLWEWVLLLQTLTLYGQFLLCEWPWCSAEGHFRSRKKKPLEKSLFDFSRTFFGRVDRPWNLYFIKGWVLKWRSLLCFQAQFLRVQSGPRCIGSFAGFWSKLLWSSAFTFSIYRFLKLVYTYKLVV